METNDVELPTTENDSLRIKARLVGLFIIIISIGLGYFFIYEKWRNMVEGVPEVTYSLKALALAPFFTVMGIYYLFLPPSGTGAYKDLTEKEKPIFIFVMILALLASATFYFWFQQQASEYGYQ